MVSRLELQPELPHVTIIKCEKCGAPAKLVDAIFGTHEHHVTERWTYVCEACSHPTVRNFDS